MRHDLLWVLLVFALAWILLGYSRRTNWGYYGYGSGALFLLIVLILVATGIL